MIAWLLLACGTPAPPPVETVGVVVAARDLSSGVPIGEDDVVIVAMEPRFVMGGVFRDPNAVIGRVPSARILANEPIRGERLADAALQRQLEGLVPPGLEVTSFDLAAEATRVPVPGTEKVDVVRAGTAEVVIAGLPVFRVDGERVSVVATPEQVRELAEEHRKTPLAVLPSGVTPL